MIVKCYCGEKLVTWWDDIPLPPRIGERMTEDGVSYRVHDVNYEKGQAFVELLQIADMTAPPTAAEPEHRLRLFN